ncbi:MAG: hypothetical protein A6D92_07065 [Symbiobacterium thermophilum]|uniref:Pyruvate phosphate dikinase AMP/ATP-binding domain-containing protein n=1 Tax=Symbiobacterium thermophilum TaxID=2734 RepID=A0A1Y2T6Q7_SYMTR|nr:MAG: hypothetical protein A6D92_07065 [Symbiobacterium thermophilum]
MYLFHEGRADMRMLLGGKGANLAEMTNIGLPVPPGFTITTEVCREYQKTKQLDPEVIEQVNAALTALEQQTGKKFGDPRNPLLVSVRSGAPISMPGMMDTVLNLGLNDETVVALAELTGNERFAWDSYRRFIQMFSNVVLGIELHNFEAILEAHKKRNGFTQDIELQAEHFKAIVPEYKAVVEKHTGKPFPMDPREQLMAAIAPCSNRGTTRARRSTGRSTRSPTTWVRPSTCRPWPSATWGRLRDGRLLHPQPELRRQGVLRRVPAQRPGRGRGGRHPHAVPDRPPEGDHARGLPAVVRPL